VRHEQVREHVDDVDPLELAADPDGQALMRERVDEVEHPEPPAIMGAVLDEVIGPDRIAVLGPQPDARAVGQPEAASLGLLGGNLQPLASPDPFHPLVVDQPACPAQQRADLAVAAITARQLDEIGSECRLILTAPRRLAARVERCCPSALQVRRSQMCRLSMTCSTQARRRAGLSRCAAQPLARSPGRSAVPHPAGSACPASGRQSPF
jgi:hypothetical protein